MTLKIMTFRNQVRYLIFFTPNDYIENIYVYIIQDIRQVLAIWNATWCFFCDVGEKDLFYIGIRNTEN